ncbi:protoporphyrinogen oxidase [Mycolicibacterium obuense]|uniref:Protoporphyrinogen oxidase n=1 Tax=Mycolicibacterium obuense TaxID=1807 RepID=A0A4R5X8T9_9MYCO|nr:FAD-dependent oxidoreductase [Mycolicibacterium obuense]TDL10048.1 protoporphyrinogen oxidase [Mycolicibacterium obuense]
MTMTRRPLIIGAGPAGLSAGLELVRRGVTPTILESSSGVGGLARTEGDGDFRVDPGGHRFFTRSEEVSEIWRSLLPEDQWLVVPRSSAMLVHNRFVRYPLMGRDLVRQLGVRDGVYGAGSYAWARLRRQIRIEPRQSNFKEWGRMEFGRRWYELFFDGYVRKTWLADPENIASDWANQRIKPIGWRLSSDAKLADQDVFRYPRHGPGQVWDAAADKLRSAGATIECNAMVTRANYKNGTWTLTTERGDVHTGDAVFASMPLRTLVNALRPAPPKYIQSVADNLRHRSLITVAVALSRNYDIPYNWVYTPGANFHAGRIQNYRRWSQHLVPKGWNGTFLGFEYFLLPDQDLWLADAHSLSAIVENDLHQLGFAKPEVEKVMISRMKFAYPIHDPIRDRSVVRIRDYLREHYPSLHPIGRNGMHHYDNQDHAMLSAIRSVGKSFGENVDPWQVNTELSYHEQGLRR